MLFSTERQGKNYRSNFKGSLISSHLERAKTTYNSCKWIENALDKSMHLHLGCFRLPFCDNSQYVINTWLLPEHISEFNGCNFPNSLRKFSPSKHFVWGVFFLIKLDTFQFKYFLSLDSFLNCGHWCSIINCPSVIFFKQFFLIISFKYWIISATQEVRRKRKIKICTHICYTWMLFAYIYNCIKYDLKVIALSTVLRAYFK